MALQLMSRRKRQSFESSGEKWPNFDDSKDGSILESVVWSSQPGSIGSGKSYRTVYQDTSGADFERGVKYIEDASPTLMSVPGKDFQSAVSAFQDFERDIRALRTFRWMFGIC